MTNKNRTSTPVSLFRTHAGWAVPAALIILSLVPVAGGIARLVSLATGAEFLPESGRFFADPLPAIVHIVSVTLFCLLGALQFSSSLRRARPRWHQRLGRPLFGAGGIAAASGLWLTMTYPPAAHDGETLYVIRVVVASAMCFAIVWGGVALVRRDFQTHGAWMTRAYALGLGAGTQVFTHLPFMLAGGALSVGERTFAMTLGWVINVVIAEWFIQNTHMPRRATVKRFPVTARASSVALAVTLAAGCATVPKAPPGAEAPSWAANTEVLGSEGWRLTDQDLDETTGWQTFERDDDKSGLRVFRTVSSIGAVPQEAAAAFRIRMLDPTLLDDGQTRQVLEQTEDSITVQGLAEVPFPMTNRETTEKYVFAYDAETGVSHIESHATHIGEPPEGYIRLPVMSTWVTFEPLGETRARVTIDMVSDLGGNIPAFFVNAISGQGGVKEVRILKEVIMRERAAPQANTSDPVGRGPAVGTADNAAE